MKIRSLLILAFLLSLSALMLNADENETEVKRIPLKVEQDGYRNR